jgi:hypothetical protein
VTQLAPNALDELDNAVAGMTGMMGFYEQALTGHHIRLLY